VFELVDYYQIKCNQTNESQENGKKEFIAGFGFLLQARKKL
jgi:hypothetical protein